MDKICSAAINRPSTCASLVWFCFVYLLDDHKRHKLGIKIETSSLPVTGIPSRTKICHQNELAEECKTYRNTCDVIQSSVDVVRENIFFFNSSMTSSERPPINLCECKWSIFEPFSVHIVILTDIRHLIVVFAVPVKQNQSTLTGIVCIRWCLNMKCDEKTLGI